MDRLFSSFFTNLKEKDYLGEFDFQTTDPLLGALLRKSIMEAVTSVAIGYVKFFSNPIGIHDETISLYLAQLVLDNERLQDPQTSARVQIKGPCVFSTFDIPLPIVYEGPLFPLQEGEELDLELICAQGEGYNHAKWATVHQCSFEPRADHLRFSLRLRGNVPLEKILRNAFLALPIVYAKANENYHSRMLLVNPESIELMGELEKY